MSKASRTKHPVVSQKEWLAARRALLAKEKELTRQRDRLSEERRALPWVKVEKDYVFDGPDGRQTLSELFEGRSQLRTYLITVVQRHFLDDRNARWGKWRPSSIARRIGPIAVLLDLLVTSAVGPEPQIVLDGERSEHLTTLG